MRERVGFIAAVERNELTFGEICERFEISRKTGYKWCARYVESGPEGLVERSRRPLHSPNATPRRVAEALEELRRRHPSWGAGKLLTILGNRHPTWQLPTRSTGCELLKRAGLVRQRRRRSRVGHPGPPLTAHSVGWLQPVPARVPRAALAMRGALAASIHTAVRGVWAAADHSDGQRVTVCVDSIGAAFAPIGVVDSSRDRA